MSKRDDDSQTDMEVGMTTAERRRRRRRGAGLRVPSDNVPRRSSTPPVVAPVPEDPALAMSIAYSFNPESSAPRETVPSFENHEGMPTVIDPPSAPVEQADFEMKTREMTAVDLEELGLSEASLSGTTMPFPRVSSPQLDPAAATLQDAPAVEADRRDATEAEDDVEVDLDSSLDGVVDAGATLDQEPVRVLVTESDDLDAAEPTTIHPGPPAPPAELAARATEASQPRPVLAEISRPVAMPPTLAPAMPPTPPMSPNAVPAMPPAPPTAAPGNDGPLPRPIATEGSPPRPAAPPVAAANEATRPVGGETPRPAMGSMAMPPVVPTGIGYRTGRAQTVALSEDDLEEVREAVRQGPPAPPRAGSTSIPPPMPPVPPKPAEARPRPAEPPQVAEIEVSGFDDKVAESSGEFEVDVDGIVESKPDDADEPGADAAAPTAAAPAEARTRSSPPPSSPPPTPHPPSIPPPTPGHATSHPALNPPRDSQPIGVVRDGHASPPPPPSGPPRDSQPMVVVRDGHAPPPLPATHKAPPSPPPARRDKSSPGLAAPLPPQIVKPDVREARHEGKPPRNKSWFADLFDEDYLRTLPFLTPQATQAEAEFVINALALTPGAQVLDVGCGYGRHAMELAARGFHVVGLDLSTPLLVRGGEEALRRGLTINFVRGDMRELNFDAQFDGVYCLFSTFGYFDDETNKKTVANFARALRPGGRLLIEVLNRDYVMSDLPTRVWWEGDGCVVLEEVELNYFTSRIEINRSVVFDDGRQLEQDISVRAYSLHEIGGLLQRSAGLRVLEVSGAYHTRGRFFGNQSRHIIVLAERKDPSAA